MSASPKQNQPSEANDQEGVWLLGMFYYNKHDKRAMVPMKNPKLGKTFNFAHRYSIYYMIAVAATVIAYNLINDFLRS